MSSIARVMKFKWEIGEKDGVKTYRLFIDREAALEAGKRQKREDAKREREMVKHVNVTQWVRGESLKSHPTKG